MDNLADKERAAFNQMLIDARWPGLEEGLSEHSLAMDAWLKGRLYERATPDLSATIKLLREALEEIEARVFPDPRQAHVYIDGIRRVAAQALAATKGDVG